MADQHEDHSGGDKMYRSNMFSKEELMTWEEKPMDDKTWVHLRTYFKDIWTATM